MVPVETLYYIQEDDVACFFSHTFCLIGPKEKKNRKKLQKEQIKLRSCCVNQQYIIGKI